jgi:hypothetical protein
LGASVDRRFSEVSEAIAEQRRYTEFAFDRLQSSMVEGFRQVHLKIDEKIGALDRKVDGKIEALDRKIDEKIGALDRKVDQKTAGLDEKLDQVLRLQRRQARTRRKNG